jgi:hypothetical protein
MPSTNFDVVGIIINIAKTNSYALQVLRIIMKVHNKFRKPRSIEKQFNIEPLSTGLMSTNYSVLPWYLHLDESGT